MFNAAKRTLIWTIALAIPIQGLPACSCGCVASCESSGASTCRHCAKEHTEFHCSSRCAGHHCCCCEQHSAKCCCCGKAACGCHHCTCSIDCPCRQAKQQPPAAPPVEPRAMGKVLTMGLTSVSTAPLFLTSNSQQSTTALASCDAMSGADRCISLCRFTL
jgi:hypothetical protein